MGSLSTGGASTGGLIKGGGGTLSTAIIPSGGGGGGGGGAGAATGGTTTARGSQATMQFSDEYVEVGLSDEVSCTIDATNGFIFISWKPFPGAAGYRIFKYRKSAGEMIWPMSRDVGGRETSFLYQYANGSKSPSEPAGGQGTVNPTAICKRCIDVDGNNGAPIQQMGSYVKALLKKYRTDSELNTATFAQFNTDAPEEMCSYIEGQTSIGSLIAEVEGCSIGFLRAEDDGTLGLYVADPAAAPVATFTDLSFVNEPLQGELQRVNTMNKVTTISNTNRATGVSETYTEYTAEADYRWKDNKEFEIGSLLTDPVANQRLANITGQIMKRQIPTLQVHVRSAGFNVKVGNNVAITNARGYTATGSYVAEKWFVSSVARDVNQAVVSFLLTKPWPNPEKFHYWAGDSVPAWASATPAQKATYSYWHDDNNLVGTEDTYKNNVWGPR